jgi:hypothetical protein
LSSPSFSPSNTLFLPEKRDAEFLCKQIKDDRWSFLIKGRLVVMYKRWEQVRECKSFLVVEIKASFWSGEDEGLLQTDVLVSLI